MKGLKESGLGCSFETFNITNSLMDDGVYASVRFAYAAASWAFFAAKLLRKGKGFC